MSDKRKAPFFSIVIATKNRPELLKRAARSILSQSFGDLEIIIVADGATKDSAQACDALVQEDARVRCISLPFRDAGHGPSFARNTGWQAARGQVLGSLDDDDIWADPDHLKRSFTNLNTFEGDVVMAQQIAFEGSTKLVGPIWLENLTQEMEGPAVVAGEDLLRGQSFCHLNTCLVSRASFEALGGLNEALRYEEDYDYFLRIVDGRFRCILDPHIVAHHFVPDRTKADNASTQSGRQANLVKRLSMLQSHMVGAETPKLRAYAISAYSQTCMLIADLAIQSGNADQATLFTRLAEAATPTLKRKLKRALAGLQSAFKT